MCKRKFITSAQLSPWIYDLLSLTLCVSIPNIYIEINKAASNCERGDEHYLDVSFSSFDSLLGYGDKCVITLMKICTICRCSGHTYGPSCSFVQFLFYWNRMVENMLLYFLGRSLKEKRHFLYYLSLREIPMVIGRLRGSSWHEWWSVSGGAALRGGYWQEPEQPEILWIFVLYL